MSDGPVHRRPRQFRLPKIELQKFNGEITGWLSWWAQFEKIHEDEDIHATDKFQYLIQATVDGTRARELVNSYPQTAANYPKVILAFQERFGKEKLLTQVYVRELLKMVINNAKSQDKIEVSKLFDRLESHLRALESLNVSGDQMSKFLYPMVESSIPEETLIAWQRSSMYEHDGSAENPPKTELDYLIEFLKKEVEREEQRAFAKSGFEGKKQMDSWKSKRKSDVPTATSLYSGKSGCLFCGKSNHTSPDCFKALKMSLEERSNKLRESRSCFVCMEKGHQAKSCRAAVCCTACQRRHYTMMCPEGQSTRSIGYQPGGMQKNEDVRKTGLTPALSNSLSNKVVLMKTLFVQAQGKNGEIVKARLVFDDGSQRSYIRSELANTLRSQIIGKLSLQNNLFGGQVTEVKYRNNYKVTVQGLDNRFKKDLELVNEDVICESCPTIPDGPWVQELAQQNIFLTDTGHESEAVDILIGSDLWGQLMTGKMYRLKCGLLAVQSVFGWTMSGPLPQRMESSCATLTISMLNSGERSLSELWSLESIGIKDSAERITQEEYDMKIQDDFKKNLTRDVDGRYVVRLPWISGEQFLPSNRTVAEKRLMSCTSKLMNQNEFDNYDRVFQDWEKEGIIEKVYGESLIADHYLPHRPVFKPESLTTPVRPVFDASCRVALGWIRRDEDWGMFVDNRVREIRKLTLETEWNHVPGQMNPADLPSRGRTPIQLVESRWWEGPVWLKCKEDWPHSQPQTNEDEVAEEKKKTSTTMTIVKTRMSKFSTFLKNVRVAAWMRRFTNNCRIEKEEAEPRIGDIVLVGQDNKKRCEWPLARILELYPGRDKKVRVAKVRTSSGVFTRPLQRLYPLEVSTSERPEVPVDVTVMVNARSKVEPVDQDMPVETRTERNQRKASRYGKWNN